MQLKININIGLINAVGILNLLEETALCLIGNHCGIYLDCGMQG